MSPYTWRQVRTVVAKEIVRAVEGDPWYPALVEAGDVVDAMRAGWGAEPPLSFGAGNGWVNWSTFACWAARYAQAPADMRLRIRQAIARGQLRPGDLGAGELERCRRGTIEDPEYETGPGFLPRAVLQPALGVLGGVLVGGGAAWLLIRLSQRRRESPATSG